MIRPSILLPLVAGLLAAGASAQGTGSESPRAVVEVGAVFQRYTSGEERDVRQVSVPLSAFLDVGSGVGVTLHGAYLSVGGDDLTSLSGLSDVQLGVSYRRPVGEASLVAALGASVPAGDRALTADEFATAAALAVDEYAFLVPSLGQGPTLAPSLTFAVPAGTGAAVGGGVAYLARGAYRPFEARDSVYAPADELLLTAGFDAQLNRGTAVALDVTFVSYGNDEFGGRTFSPGNKLGAVMRWTWGGRPIQGRLLMLYRHLLDGGGPTEARPVPPPRPSQAMLMGGVRVERETFGLDFSTGLRYYGRIGGLEDGSLGSVIDFLGEQQLLLDLGFAPDVTVSPGVRLKGGFTYSLGIGEVVEISGITPLTGFRAGAGIEVALLRPAAR